jgi:hypothetical protein
VNRALVVEQLREEVLTLSWDDRIDLQFRRSNDLRKNPFVEDDRCFPEGLADSCANPRRPRLGVNAGVPMAAGGPMAG